MAEHNITDQAFVNGYQSGYEAGRRSVGGITPDKTPTGDAVEVVRCKDCKHRTTLWGRRDCPYCDGFAREDNHFCSYGERKE